MSKWDVLHVTTLQVDEAVAESEVRRAIEQGRLGREDCLRRTGEQRWWRIHELPEFQNALATGTRTVGARTKPAGRAQEKPARSPVAPALAAPSEELPASSLKKPLPLRRKRRIAYEDIDMAPAATLALLLILFFIVASTVILQKAIEFPKPSVDDNTSAPMVQSLDELKDDHIVVRIRGDNTILVDEDPVGEVALAARLTELRRQRAVTDLIIRANEQAHHETLVGVVNAANLASIPNIKLASPSGRRPAKSSVRRRVRK